MLSVIFFLFNACAKQQDVPLPITSSNEKAVELYKEAFIHWYSNEGRENREKLEAALRIDPNFVLANLYINMNDPVLNRNFRSRAIEHKNDVSNAEKYQVEMQMAYRDGKLNEAVSIGKKLVNEYPNSSEAYVLLGEAYYALLDWDNSFDNYNKALALNPKNYRAWYDLMQQQVPNNFNTLLPTERLDSKLGYKYADGLVSSMPENPNAWRLRGNIERYFGNFNEAQEYYDKSVEMCDLTGSSFKGLALMISAHNLTFSGQHSNALNNYEMSKKIQTLGNIKVQVMLFKSTSYLMVNDYYGALDVMDQLDSELGSYGLSKNVLLQRKGVVNRFRFFINAHLQEEETAREALSASIDYRQQAMSMRNPDSIQKENFEANVLADEAWYNILFGNYALAQTKLKEHYQIVSDDESPAALDRYNAYSGMIAVMKGDPENAMQYFNDNITRDTYTYFSYFKGLALKGSGKVEEANEIFEHLANYSFMDWGAALVRDLSKKQLSS